MIAESRAYIKEQIAKVDSDLKENKSAFYRNDIPETIIDSTYQVLINNYNNITRTEYREDQVSVQILLFGTGYQDEIERYDILFDKAICIRDTIINIKNIDLADYIVNVEAGSIDVDTIDTNDNSFQFTINLTLYLAYLTGE